MFDKFKNAIAAKFDTIKDKTLLRMDVSKDDMWKTYLGSFKEGDDPMFRERTEHDCQQCKRFIRSTGNLVAVVDNQLVSIWDVEVGGIYQVVADALSKLVKEASIRNVFLTDEKKAGTDKNVQVIVGSPNITWEHFHLVLPSRVVIKSDKIDSKLGKIRTSVQVLSRGLKEITVDSIETVIDLIDQNSLYRGEEHLFVVKEFAKIKVKYDSISSDQEKEIFCWTLNAPASVSSIRGTSIGTLLTDLSEGRDLESAVKSFEAKVAPTNYKRPTALITKGMIRNAEKKVDELGYTDSLPRRMAVTKDLTINNVLFANYDAKKEMSVFDEMEKESAVPSKKSLDKVEEMHIDKFMADVLPKVSSVEVMLDNKHTPNMVSLVAPVHAEAKGMFKWGNKFSWAYAGEVADSIKELVKGAGGNVSGDLRCSLAWYNPDDLDLHLVEPGGKHIHYGDPRNDRTGGNLDVDMNAGGKRHDTAPVENITYPTRSKMIEGKYRLYVNQYSKRTTERPGFVVEMEMDGVIHTFEYTKEVRQKENVEVATFEYTHAGGLKIIKSMPSTQTPKEVWGIKTQQFHKVSMIMNSPNHWDGEQTGNKHWFFMIENCRREGSARGFFNEFLVDSLREHRKVFEVLGSKMKAPESEEQLSGIGFSSTQRNHIFCRVTGSFSRTVKITF
jgi:hypothetical protein